MRIEQKEIAASLDAGRGDQWGIDEYLLAGNFLCRVDPRSPRLRWYAPLEHAELPGVFAAIATSRDPRAATLEFCQAYGRLGFDEHGDLVDRWRHCRKEHWPEWSDHYSDRRRRFDEPLGWIRAHADTVRWCLRAIQHVQARRGDPGRVWNERPERWALGLRVVRTQEWVAVHPTPDIPLVVHEVLRANIHMRREVVYDRARQAFRNLWRGEALLDSIYELVADAAVGGAVRLCEECGNGFIQTDARQRFCPPSVNEEASRCGTRKRVREKRARDATARKPGAERAKTGQKATGGRPR